MALAQHIRDRLTLPTAAAPMFFCSGVDLASEACKAGLAGSLTRNNSRDIAQFEADLGTVAERLARHADSHPGSRIGPLIVNLPTHYDAEEMRENLSLCRRHGAEIIVTSVGDPTRAVAMIHDMGMLHFHDATSMRFAEKAIAGGVDGIVAIGAGGGGHSGTLSHLAFVPQLRAIFGGTICMAGAVTDGAAIRAAEILGADLAYMGTRFIATREGVASDDYKRMLVEGTASDVLYTRNVNGLPAMWLKASLRRVGLDPDDLPVPAKRGTEHLPEGVMPWRDIWSASQGIGQIRDLPSVAELVRRLRREYAEACALPDMRAAALAGLDRPASAA